MHNKNNNMNNEKKLYDYIQRNNGCIYANYDLLAEELGVCPTTIKNYKNKLVRNKQISSRCEVINGKKTMIFNVIKNKEKKNNGK